MLKAKSKGQDKGIGWSLPLRKITRKTWQVWMIPVLLLAVIQLYFSIKYVSSDINKGESFILDIKNNCSKTFDHKTILARKPHIAYYLNCNFRPLQYFTNEDEFFDQIKDVDYVYIGMFELRMLGGNVNWLNNEIFEVAYCDFKHKILILKIRKWVN